MTLPVAVAVAIIGCVLAVSANVETDKAHQALEQERYKRLVAERQLLEAEGAIKKFKSALEQSHSKITTIQDIVNKGASTNESLQSQLNSIQQEKDTLRRQIQRLQEAATAAPIEAVENFVDQPILLGP